MLVPYIQKQLELKKNDPNGMRESKERKRNKKRLICSSLQDEEQDKVRLVVNDFH